MLLDQNGVNPDKPITAKHHVVVLLRTGARKWLTYYSGEAAPIPTKYMTTAKHRSCGLLSAAPLGW